MTLTAVKIFKFTSLKIVLLAYFPIILAFIISAIVRANAFPLGFSDNYADVLNSPFQLTIPLIEPAYGRSC